MRNGAIALAAVATSALAGAGISTTAVAARSAICRRSRRVHVPGRQLAADPQRWLQQPGAVRDHLDGHPGRRCQARVADHPGEQVLRRDLHRAEPEQLPVADVAPAGRAPDELLRHRPLQHGQLHLAGVGPGAVLRRAGRLLDDGEHDQQQQRDHHERHGGDGRPTPTTPPTAPGPTPRHRTPPPPTTATTASCSCTAAIDASLANNGCVYPTDVSTLFNQFNAAGVSWKAYAQDLGGAQPVGVDDVRDRLHAGRQRHRAGA